MKNARSRLWFFVILFIALLAGIGGVMLPASRLDAGTPSHNRPPTAATAVENPPATTSDTADSPDASGSEAASPASAILDGADFSNLSTEAALRLAEAPARDLAALALRLDPTLGPIPTVFNETPPDYETGDRIEFWVHNSGTAENRRITAELVHKNDVAYAWVEEGEPFDDEALRAAVDHFSDTIYPLATAAFGSEANPGVDNDPRLHILHTTGLGGGVAGYYLGSDENSSLVYPASNEKEMFYISLDWLRAVDYGAEYEHVLAHEFQHMIHHAQDANDEVWINEGLSEYAVDAAAAGAFGVATPDRGIFATRFSTTQLNAWGGANSDNSAHYAIAYLFVHYLTQRFGDQIAGEIVAEPANGIEGVRRVLARSTYAIDFATVFGEWAVANAMGGSNSDARYGYAASSLPLIDPERQLSAYPAELEGSVPNFATSYVLLNGDSPDDASLAFAGNASTTVMPLAAAPGDRFWWSNRTDRSETRLTRHFDLSELAATAPVTMSVQTWWEIEADYDYGYLMASADGEVWGILPGDYTTERNPSGASFGAAYTGPAPSADAQGDPTWLTETYDLSAYAGGDLWLRFSYITDDAVTWPGWLVNDVSIPALGYVEDFDGDAGGWESEGWLLSDGVLAQDWLLQAIALQDGELVDVQIIEVDEQGNASWEVGALGEGRSVLLTITGMTDYTTEDARYSLVVE